MKVTQLENHVAVEINNLIKYYGDFCAVNNISLEIPVGEILGILGPNGAGKTTTIECIVGLREPSVGTIKILGLAQQPNKEKIKTLIGVQPQEASLLPNLKVIETIRLFASFYVDPYDIDELIKMVDLEEKANTLVKNLSGGQKQRLLIAVALVSNAQILFLDEPTGSLDPRARRNLWDLILKFRGENRTVILTTHSMDEAESLCDRVAIIDRGNIIACDTPEKLVDTYVSEKTICFTTSDRTVQLENIRTFSEVITVEEKLVEGAKEIKIHTTHSDTTINRLSKGELSIGSWSNLRIESANLEDVFLRLTGRSILEEV